VITLFKQKIPTSLLCVDQIGKAF